MKNVNEMSTAEMVAEYNALTGKSIKKFSSRAAGERQLESARKMSDTKALFTGKAAVATPKKAAAKPAAKKPAKEEKKAYHPDDGCPNCHQKEDQTYAGPDGTAAAERLFCHHCSTEYYQDGRIYNAPAKSETRSAAISESWNNKKVAKARATRHAVRVKGTLRGKEVDAVFRSTLKAFQELGLPISGHIKFRMELKAAGRATYDGFKFSIVAAD